MPGACRQYRLAVARGATEETERQAGSAAHRSAREARAGPPSPCGLHRRLGPAARGLVGVGVPAGVGRRPAGVAGPSSLVVARRVAKEESVAGQSARAALHRRPVIARGA